MQRIGFAECRHIQLLPVFQSALLLQPYTRCEVAESWSADPVRSAATRSTLSCQYVATACLPPSPPPGDRPSEVGASVQRIACSHAILNHQHICMQKDNEFHDEELFPDQPPHLVLQLPHLHSMVLGSYAAWQALPSALSLKYLEDLDLLVGSNSNL